MYGIGLPELMVIAIITAIIGSLVVLPYCKIFSKAGFSGWLGLTQIIPVLNFIMLFYLAFAKWPIHNKTDQKDIFAEIRR